MENNGTRTVEEIMNSMKCQKYFACVKNGFENVSRTSCFADKFFTCTGSNSYMCPYILPFGYSYFCTCPLFGYIAQKNYRGRKIIAAKKLIINEAEFQYAEHTETGEAGLRVHLDKDS